MADLLTQCCDAYAEETGDPCDRTAMAEVLRRITEVILDLPTTADGRAVALLLLKAAASPSPCTTTFMTPMLEHTTSMVLGCSVAAKTDTPTNSTYQTNTRRLSE